MSDAKRYDILVIGKSGNGKSAVCNTIAGEAKFTVGRSLAATTTTADSAVVHRHGVTMNVIDTPDIVNCIKNDNERRDEVTKWKSLIKFGEKTLVVLLIIRSDVRYTNEEYRVFEEINRCWGSSPSLKKGLIVAFTFGDTLEEDIAETVKSPPPELMKVLAGDAKNRYVLFKHTKNDNKDEQLADLLKCIHTKKKKPKCPCPFSYCNIL